MIKKTIILTFVLLVFTKVVFSQVGLNFKVLEKDTQTPIPFAHFYIKNLKIGTYSNEEGRVLFEHPPLSKSDTILISCMGYETKKLLIENLESVIYLNKSQLFLSELVIEAKKEKFKLKEFLQKAIDKIPNNHSLNTSLRGFYRQIHYSRPIKYYKLPNGKQASQIGAYSSQYKYLNLKEAYIDYDKQSENLKIYHLRRSNDYRKFILSELVNKYPYGVECIELL